MSDTISAGVVDAPVSIGGATATETPESSQGTESVASENGTEQAGGEQSSSEGGSAEGQAVRPRGPSKLDTIRELRTKLRDQRGYFESEFAALKSQLEEFRNQIASGQQGKKPGKTFWEAPEEVLEERLSSHLSDLEKRMQSKFEQTQVQREESQLRQQEVSEAAKFIRSQKNLTEDDIQDIREILQSNPQLENLPPMDQAEFALYKWQKARGITDNTAKKERASTVTGAPAAAGGRKVWTESEIEAEMNKFPSNVANWTKEDEARFKRVDDEIRTAYREKRVTK